MLGGRAGTTEDVALDDGGAAPRFRPACRDEFHATVDALRRTDHVDTLWVFWCGPGALDSVSLDQRLFYADAEDGNERNLDLDDLMNSGRTTFFPALRHLFVAVDLHEGALGPGGESASCSPRPPPTDTFGKGRLDRGRTIASLVAVALEKAAAATIGHDHPSSTNFVEILLDVLGRQSAGESTSWPAVRGAVLDRLARDPGTSAQTRLFFRDPGNPRERQLLLRDAASASGPDVPALWLVPDCDEGLPAVSLPAEGGLLSRRLITGEAGYIAVVPMGDVSAPHCRITPLSDTTWLVRDSSSLNGTFVNDRPVRTAVVTSGDILRLGPQVCFRLRSVLLDAKR
ncbi:FHA domain-containing protein [Frankia sp. CiP3]|uniref:FHA domain-containing protein n=1 Tax=Frankia sp. CiP3 TaxID=2880971 RepID=UPI001EF5F2DB|nr:FHA domain-containing protein [Frankia sp. CiP3]